MKTEFQSLMQIHNDRYRLKNNILPKKRGKSPNPRVSVLQILLIIIPKSILHFRQKSDNMQKIVNFIIQSEDQPVWSDEKDLFNRLQGNLKTDLSQFKDLCWWVINNDTTRRSLQDTDDNSYK